MQGFCLALYHRRIEIRRGLGTRQVTQELEKITIQKRSKRVNEPLKTGVVLLDTLRINRWADNNVIAQNNR